MTDQHWVRWHAAYDDPASALSQRLVLVQDQLRQALDASPDGPVQVISMCAGQGRDVIGVLAEHPRRADVAALLVERNGQLVEDARRSAAAAGLDVVVLQVDAADTGSYASAVPADVLLVCGVFGNISDDDVRQTIVELPHLCAEGATVLWTRHTRLPDLTPAIRGWFAESGFEELSYSSPEGTFAVGAHRMRVPARAYRPDRGLFSFVGDGTSPG